MGLRLAAISPGGKWWYGLRYRTFTHEQPIHTGCRHPDYAYQETHTPAKNNKNAKTPSRK